MGSAVGGLALSACCFFGFFFAVGPLCAGSPAPSGTTDREAFNRAVQGAFGVCCHIQSFAAGIAVDGGDCPPDVC